MNSRLYRLLPAGLACVVFCSQGLALPDDREQRLDIDASSSDILLDEDLILYRGTADDPVVVTQGSLRIEGLEMENRGAVNEENPVSLLMTGNPARFQQQPRLDSGIVHGSGGRLGYEESDDLVTLVDEARLDMEGNLVEGDRIEYRSQQATITAFRNEAEQVYVEVATDDGKVTARADEAVYEEQARLLTALGTADSQVRIEAPTDDGVVTGYGDKATYDDTTGIITLEGNTCLEVKGSVVRGHIASYNRQTRVASVSGEGDDGRINISDRAGNCR